jgi:thymidylate synthase (FAD)
MEKVGNLVKKKYLYADNIGFLDLVQYMGEDITVVNSARVSFGVQKSEIDSKDKKLINYLVKHKHTSTLEHNIVTFRIKVPLFVRSQHHRHRTWSYNEISRRYTDYNIEFYTPKSFRTQHKTNRQASSSEDLIDPKVYLSSWSGEAKVSELYKEHCRESLDLFNNFVESGVCKEQARGILPQTMYTEYYATANLNNVLKFIELRTHEGAQWEIQQLAIKMLDIIKELWPITVESYINK